MEGPELRRIGQGLVEYALVLALLVLVVVLALTAMGVSTQQAFSKVVEALGVKQVSSCEILYQSQFDRGMNEWSPLTGGFWKGGWRIIDGRLVGESLAAAILDTVNETDYIVTAEAIKLEMLRSTYQGFGIIFRASVHKQKLSGYMFEIEKKNAADRGLMYFSKWVKGYQIFPPLASVEVPSRFDWSKISQMRIVAQGDTFIAFVDGQEVLRVQDSTYTQGKAGVAVNYGSRATINNFSIASVGCP